jgi:hypothetical protein
MLLGFPTKFLSTIFVSLGNRPSCQNRAQPPSHSQGTQNESTSIIYFNNQFIMHNKTLGHHYGYTLVLSPQSHTLSTRPKNHGCDRINQSSPQILTPFAKIIRIGKT